MSNRPYLEDIIVHTADHPHRERRLAPLLVMTLALTAVMAGSLAGSAAAANPSDTEEPVPLTWSKRHFIRDRAWTSGDALARSTRTSPSRSYLHTAITTDYFGGRYATDSGSKLGVFYSRSSDGGSSWKALQRVSPKTKHADRGVIAASGSRVYVGYVTQTKWVHYSHKAPRVLYVRTNASYGSGDWKTAKRLTPLAGRVDYPSIAAYGKNVYVAYTNASTGTVKIAISRERGSTWKTKALGSTSNTLKDGITGAPSVSAYGSLVVVAWTADGDGMIRAKVSGDKGVTWSSATLATTAEGWATTGAASGRVSVAWAVDGGLAVRTWRPSAWEPEVAVGPPGELDTYAWHLTPAIALQGSGQTGIAWSGCRFDCDSSNPGLEILWSESADGGATFPDPGVVVATNQGSQHWYPSVVWGSATTRYLLYSSDGWEAGGYAINIRTGSGTP